VTDIYSEIVGLLERDERAALATLVIRRGSAPGALGSKMLVGQDGTSLGSIGGGCVEADVWQAAMTALKTGVSEMISFRLSGQEAAESGLICGGAIEVLVEPLEVRHLAVYQAAASACERGERGVLGTVLPTHPLSGTKFFLADGGKPVCEVSIDAWAAAATDGLATAGGDSVRVVCSDAEDDGQRLLLEFLARPTTLIVLGAGHLSREIVPLAKRVHFRVVVVDDRPVFANQANFPDADEVIVAEFADIFARLSVDAQTFVLIVTRGHLHDELLLEHALGSSAGYVGMIGSKAKIGRIYSRLRAGGTTDERLAFVHAPVGLSIGARLPEEIAVSVVAELISVRNGTRGGT
jgi:xanthine dehydrogenase accessory factor